MKINIEKNLLKIALTISLIGIVLLLIILNTDILQPKPVNIEDINSTLLNEKVQIQGIISNIRTYEDSNFQIISIKDKTGEIDIVLNNPINTTNNQNITVIGTIGEYNQTLQIQADKIIKNIQS